MATHRPLNMARVHWVENGRLAAFNSSRPGFAVQNIATGEVLSRDGITPSVWRTKAVAQEIADHAHAMEEDGWVTVAVRIP